MRQLSIQEKASRYDEAIERAKEINREHSKKGFKPSDDILYIFPELKESEDERIKDLIYLSIEKGMGIPSAEDRKKALAWIEKQGEQKPAWSEEDEEMIKYFNELLNYAFKNWTKFEGNAVNATNWLEVLKERIGGKL